MFYFLYAVDVTDTQHISFLVAGTNLMELNVDIIQSDITHEFSETDETSAPQFSCYRSPLTRLGFNSMRRLMGASLPPRNSFKLLEKHAQRKLWRLLRGNPKGIRKFSRLVYELDSRYSAHEQPAASSAAASAATPAPCAELEKLARKVCTIVSLILFRWV